MKKLLPYLTFMALPVLFSCNQSGNAGSDQKGSLKSKVDTAILKECFIAIDANDTANLSIDTWENGKVKGHLVINYLEKGKNDGLVDGVYRGDTLFVDYTFKIGLENKTIYKNPLAFLKKDGKLILGVGQIETSVGKSYFVKGKPINFDRGRFTFTPTDCKN